MKIRVSIFPSRVLLLVASILLISGCVKEFNNNDTEETDRPIFDFNTRAVSTLRVQYDVPANYQVYFEVYTQNPEELDEAGQIVKKEIEPIDVGFTDGDGSYNHKISIPQSAKQLYIYSPYVGVPRILIANINSDGSISEAKLPDAASPALRGGISPAAADYKNEPYNTISGGPLQRLGYWINDDGYQLNGTSYRLYGRPDYVAQEKITVSADILNLINKTLPESGKVDSKLIKNGDIRVAKRANVYVHLIEEQTSANSTLAYYCYDTNNPPKNASEIDDIIILFPNSKIFKYHIYNPTGNNGALERGEGVKLHYWKNGVDKGDEFPENTSIGWVIYNQSYATCISNNALEARQTRFFAAKKLNSDNRNHVALFRSGDKVIFGFEDWDQDYDYNDLVFYVKSNPIEAIIPDVPEIDPEEPTDDKVAAKVTYNGILTFEDLWPYRGDFDMNDVIVQYESTVGYNKKNEVLQTEDKYTILHSGASIDNSFAYQLDVRSNEVEVLVTSSQGGDGGAYLDQTMDKATIRLANNLLSYANLPEKTVFNVVAKYKGRRLAKDDFTKPPYNPFITTRSEDIEVHLTNKRPTEKLDSKLLGSGNDRSQPNRNLYYITYDEQQVQMPFAIDIAFEKKEDMKLFVIPKEKERIDVYYPNFLNWIKSNGKQDKDWYLRHKK